VLCRVQVFANVCGMMCFQLERLLARLSESTAALGAWWPCYSCAAAACGARALFQVITLILPASCVTSRGVRLVMPKCMPGQVRTV
jgi:hypothetical protein